MYFIEDYSDKELQETLEAAKAELEVIRELKARAKLPAPPSAPSGRCNTVDQLHLMGDYLRRERAAYNMSSRVFIKHTWEDRYPSQKHRQLIYRGIESNEQRTKR